MIAVDIASGYVVRQNLQAKFSGLYGGSLATGTSVGQFMRTSSEPAMRMRGKAIPQCVRGITVEDDEEICTRY